MKYNTPELLPLGTIETSVLQTSFGEPPDSTTDPEASRVKSSVLDLD